MCLRTSLPLRHIIETRHCAGFFMHQINLPQREGEKPRGSTSLSGTKSTAEGARRVKDREVLEDIPPSGPYYRSPLNCVFFVLNNIPKLQYNGQFKLNCNESIQVLLKLVILTPMFSSVASFTGVLRNRSRFQILMNVDKSLKLVSSSQTILNCRCGGSPSAVKPVSGCKDRWIVRCTVERCYAKNIGQGLDMTVYGWNQLSQHAYR